MIRRNNRLRILFFSDAHLGANDEYLNRRKLLIQFLNKVGSSCDKIIINGDLFDFWFEYKYAIPKGYLDILSELYFLRKKGKEIFYIAGNHDFWMDRYLNEELGIELYKDEFEFEVDGYKFWVFHGDGIAKKDVGYRILKKIFRFRPNIWLYRWLHPDIGIPLAKKISHSSREASKYKDLKDEQDYIEYAQKIAQKGYDFIILGHRHQPTLEKVETKTYVNLGDWINHFSYAIYEQGKITLEFYKDNIE